MDMSVRALVTALVIVVSLPLMAADADDLFQQALVAERSMGDLQKAITLYGRVVEQAGPNRSLAVRALLKMGAAYEKLGQAEAKKAYERIVREYADQSSAVEAARERLARIEKLDAPETVIAQEGPRSRLLSNEIGDAEGEVSLDGRYFSFVSWETGDMAVRDLSSGENRLLTDSGDWSASNDFGGQSRFSPDGRTLAYTWYDNEGVIDLRTVSVKGDSPPQILLRDASIAYVEPGRFSPDGKRLLVSVQRKNEIHELAVLELDSRELEVLTTHTHHVHPIEFSPDSQYVLYSAAPSEAERRDLFLISASGGDPLPLAPHSSPELGLGFSPGGDRVLFTSGRSGGRGLWEIAVKDGNPEGEPRLVRSDLGDIAPFGIARDGAIYYGLRHDFRDAYVVDLDAEGKASGDPKRIGDIVGQDQRPVWSADGKRMLFISYRGAGNASLPNEPVYVFRDLDSGEERVLVSSIRPPRRPVTIAWSPDQRWMAFYGTTGPDLEEGLYVVDTASGEAVRLHANRQTQPVWSSDSRMLYYSDIDGEGLSEWQVDERAVIRAWDRESGATSIFFQAGPEERIGALALSPDGKHLGFRMVEGDHAELDIIKVIPLEGGVPEDLLREPVTRRGSNISNGAGMAFTPDGKYLLFGRWESWGNSNNNIELFRVSTRGGPSEPLGVKMNFIVGLSINPNGRQIGFTSGGRSFSELWVLENFLNEAEQTSASR